MSKFRHLVTDHLKRCVYTFVCDSKQLIYLIAFCFVYTREAFELSISIYNFLIEQ